MITVLLSIALVLTLLLAVTLPFGGWGSGMDAAGRGMAMFFPVIFMTARIACFAVAVIMLASGGALAWSGLPGAAAAVIALAIIAGMGASSLAAASLLAQAPRTYGRGSYAFLAVIAAPIVVAIWLFAAANAADPAQLWVALGLVVLAALGPLPLLFAIQRHQAEMRALADAQEKAAEEAAQAHAAQLSPDADFIGALRFYDSITDDNARARGPVIERIKAMPGWTEAFMQALSSGSWDDKVLASFHATALSPPVAPDYFTAARPIVEEIVRHLESGDRPIEVLVREAAAGVRIAWPAINNDGLPKALMARFLAGVEARAGETALRNYVHDVKMLADYVNG